MLTLHLVLINGFSLCFLIICNLYCILHKENKDEIICQYVDRQSVNFQSYKNASHSIFHHYTSISSFSLFNINLNLKFVELIIFKN